MSPPRTSHTDPLRIDFVETPGGGRIGMTLCPGKHQRDALSGHWERDLDADLERIAGSGASVLVCLLEADELDALEVPDLGERCRARGIEFLHLPIRDTEPPGERLERAWPEAGARLRALLAAGGACVVHCKGGLGRTGTVAARLLVEMGAEPERAIEAVREARDGAIENRAQERYVLGLAAGAG